MDVHAACATGHCLHMVQALLGDLTLVHHVLDVKVSAPITNTTSELDTQLTRWKGSACTREISRSSMYVQERPMAWI